MKPPVCALIFCLTAISSKAQPTLTQQPTNQIVNNGGTASFSVAAGGTGPITYQWRLNGNNLPAPGIITTVAGGGVGDGFAPTNAALNYPTGVAMDAAGNLFIADRKNHRIRKVATNGVITSMAGNGFGDHSGDGFAATNAALNYPSGVAMDAAGNLLIADTANHRIRKVDANGVIATVAGNGSPSFSGDGGAAISSALNFPASVVVDGIGNLYIADQGNNRVRKVGTDGIITTVAGNGSYDFFGDGSAATNAALRFPSGVAVDRVGNLFIADQNNNRIRKVDTNGIITTVAGNQPGFSGDGGTATNARLWEPFGVAVDRVGNLFIADKNNNRIRRVGTNGIITTVAGNGSYFFAGDGGAATNAALEIPSGVAVDVVGNLFIADTYNYRIRKVGTNAVITTVAGNGFFSGGFTGDGGTATNAALRFPFGVAVDRLGNLFIADQNNNRIRKVGVNGIITTVAGNGTQGFSGDGSAATNANLAFPSGVTVDTIGNLFIADYSNQRIRKVDTSGIITTVAGNGNYDFTDDGGAATNAALNFPTGVAVDGVGNLFIADRENQRIRKVDPNGIITTVAGNGSHDFSGDGGAATNAGLQYPFGVAFNGFENLFIADLDNRRVRAVDNSGVITTVAGNGTSDVSGDGGAATNAGVIPSSVAVDDAGDLFISDIRNDRIRKVTGPSSRLPVLVLSGVTASSAGDYDVVVSNSSGSVTSIVATLTVVSPLPLQFISPGLSNNQFNALLTGTIGGGYVIQVSSNLAVSSWSPIATGAIPPSGSITITDAVSTSHSQKFYRAVSSP